MTQHEYLTADGLIAENLIAEDPSSELPEP